jgi:hypothetical protein
MQRTQPWLDIPAPTPAPISRLDWLGLAGAVEFTNGERPVLAQFETPADGLVQICAAGEGCEIHYFAGEGPDHEGRCWQFAAELPTALMGELLVAEAIKLTLLLGPAEAAKRLGWPQII